MIGERLGPWELVRVLGRGGMGLVYEGRDPSSGATVALKVLSKGADAEAVERFYWEAFVLSTIKHENVVGLRGKIERAGGNTFYAMELVEGQDLAELLRARGGLTVPEAVTVARAVLSALGAIHARGFVHRDVKPKNVMLTREGRIVLVDFGIVRAIDGPGITRVGTYVGTPDYMAPEQKESGDVTPRTDVYGVGMLLTELVLGRVGKGLEGELAPIVGKALAARPEDRFASAAEFDSALARLDMDEAGRRGLLALAGQQDTVVARAGGAPVAAAPVPAEPVVLPAPVAPPVPVLRAPYPEHVHGPMAPPEGRGYGVRGAAALLFAAAVVLAIVSFSRGEEFPYVVEVDATLVDAQVVRVDEREVVIVTRDGERTVPRERVKRIQRRGR